jgi:hypothetical protein
MNFSDESKIDVYETACTTDHLLDHLANSRLHVNLLSHRDTSYRELTPRHRP